VRVVVGGLQERQLRNVNGVHPGLVRHEVFEVVLDGFGDFNDMALDLALQPKTQARVMDSYCIKVRPRSALLTCLSRNFNLLDVVFIHNFLEPYFGIFISIVVVDHSINLQIN
jgi:hypothetical protein